MNENKPLNDFHAVIMAGGKGTRFWPLSRSERAKQFLDIVDNTPLLELTILRLSGLVPRNNIWIVGNAHQMKYLADYANLIPEENILVEPEGKNTAPCIAWAAREVARRNPDSIMALLPSDHYIADRKSYQKNLREAYHYARTHDCLMTIGIKPTHPHTGYGYIEAADKTSAISTVKSFKEKPDVHTAQRYLDSGSYFWNAGQFIWQTQTILALFDQHLPDMAAINNQIAALNRTAPDYAGQLAALYHQFESISIDYGIMEKAGDRTCVLQSEFDWSDIGNWGAIEAFWPKDSHHNASKANLLAVNSENNIVYSEKRLVGLAGVSDMIIVDTDDALLVMPKKDDQQIKDLYNQLPEQYR